MAGASQVFVRGYGRDGREARFWGEVLPQLASHYRREALKELEEKCPWLKTFRSAQPALNDARDHFFRDGSDCINNIEKHTELVWLAAVNDALTADLGLTYTVFLAEFYKGVENATMLEEGEASRAQFDYIAEHEWMRDRIKEQIELDSLVHSFVEAEEAMRVENRARPIANKSRYFGKNAMVALEIARALVKDPAEQGHNRSIVEELENIEANYRNFKSSALIPYDTNIKNFTYKVGCPEAHEDPQRNVAELRKCHATQMPFFQKLQTDLQAQIKLNNEQREIITALEFRHLIEHLPPNPYKDKTNATDRWLAFWEDAVRTEYLPPTPTDHPLKGLVNEKVFPTLSGPLVESSTKQPVTRNSTGQPVDRDFIKGTINESGEKAQMYRLGKELFGIMSKNIHAYETKGKGKEGYEIGSDHWGKAVRDILKRLVPVEYDRDDDNNDVVNWERERKRYVPADGILLTTKAEVPGQPGKPGKSGKPVKPYDGKLNGYT